MENIGVGRANQIKTGFKEIYGDMDISNDNMYNLCQEIITNPDSYPFEDDNATAGRLWSNIGGPGDHSGISKWIAHVPDEVFNDCEYTSAYAKLFHIGKKYGMGEALLNDGVVKEDLSVIDKDIPVEDIPPMEYEEPVVPTTNGMGTPQEVSKEDNDNKQNNLNLNEEKGEIKMSNAIDELKVQAGMQGQNTLGDTMDGNTKEVSIEARKAAKEYVKESATARMNYSEQAVVEDVLITEFARKDKAVDGVNAKGVVSNPAKELEKFIAKTGMQEEGGEIKFTKLFETETHDNALKIYEVLKKAVEDPQLLVDPFMGKEEADKSIKGYKIKNPEGGIELVALKDIPSLLLNKTYLYINFKNAAGQLKLEAAKAKNGKAPTKSYTSKVAGKKEILNDENSLIRVKTIDKTSAVLKTGFKSELKVDCISKRVTTKGEAMKSTFRISLIVNQHDIVTEKGFEDIFSTVGGGNVTTPYDVKNDVELMSGVLNEILASEFSKGSSVLDKGIKTKLEENEEAIAKQAGAAVANLAGGADANAF